MITRRGTLPKLLLASVVLTALLGIGAVQAQSQPKLSNPNNLGADEIPNAIIKPEILIPVPDAANVAGPDAESRAAYLAEGRVSDLSQYIGLVYNFLISIVGVVAAVMMIVGGFEYVVSRGDAGKVGAAKSRMANAFIGMILVFGAWVILNTINPALLEFKPISGVINVKTELSFLPWCEDLVDPKTSQQVGATPVGGNTDCGNLGRFRYDGQNSDQYCVYKGPTCGVGKYMANNDTTRSQTCLQRPGMNTAELDKLIREKGNGVKVAHCVMCMDITDASSVELGYGTLDLACEGWWRLREQQWAALVAAGKLTGKEGGGRYHSYCRAAESHPSCVEAFIDCYAVNRNLDDEDEGTGLVGLGLAVGGSIVGTGASDVLEARGYVGCQGYDDEPYATWRKDNYTLEQVLTGDTSFYYAGEADLDWTPDHLTSVCEWNPCKDYVDYDNKLPLFAKGCGRGNGIASGIVRFVRKNDTSYNDCRDK